MYSDSILMKRMIKTLLSIEKELATINEKISVGELTEMDEKIGNVQKIQNSK